MTSECCIDDYAPLDADMEAYFAGQDKQQMDDPIKGIQVLIDMVDGGTAIQGAAKNTTVRHLGNESGSMRH